MQIGKIKLEEIALEVLSSFLGNGILSDRLDGAITSEIYCAIAGVPQSSVLVPMSFINLSKLNNLHIL